jgi:hypothetical protein
MFLNWFYRKSHLPAPLPVDPAPRDVSFLARFIGEILLFVMERRDRQPTYFGNGQAGRKMIDPGISPASAESERPLAPNERWVVFNGRPRRFKI